MGSATLGGTLRVVLLDGYTPKIGDVLHFIHATSISGTFAQIVAPGLEVKAVPSVDGFAIKVIGISRAATAPVVTSIAPLAAYVATPYDFQVTGTNNVGGFGAQGLPDGLDIDPATGLIAGTPTTPGSYPVLLTATDPNGTGTASITLTVSNALPPLVPKITSEAICLGASRHTVHPIRSTPAIRPRATPRAVCLPA